MAWIDDRATDASLIVTEQGQSITYTAFGAAGVAATAIWTPDDADPEVVIDGSAQALRGTVQLLPTVATSPDARDLFTIGGVTYKVESIQHRAWIVAYRVVTIDLP